MRIGIITFHWAVNYGAILQTYALQTYLENKGHEVWIINYKPKKYDLTYLNILLYPKTFIRFKSFCKERKKDKELQKFRDAKLNLTRRYFSTEELKNDPPNFDVYISGSDQILNPSFTLYGDKKPSSAYYLNFGNKNIKRYGYAVSFGCVIYPLNAKEIAEPLLKNFDFISVRENTGIEILKSMSYTNSSVAPDPTLLLNSSYYDSLIINNKPEVKFSYVYILRDRDYDSKIKELIPNAKFADDFEFSISNWLSNIKYSEYVITNSYHGMIFCLHYHIPFVVLLATKENIGMNDRFYTLLEKVGLLDRIIEYRSIEQITYVVEKPIDWLIVDSRIRVFVEDMLINITL